MNYLEEQQQELEALESIFGDDYQLISAPAPPTSGPKFQISLNDFSNDPPLRTRIIFTCSAKYPEVPPFVAVHADEGLSASKRKALQVILDEEAAKHEGAPVAFQVHTVAMDWIQDHVIHGSANDDENDELISGVKSLKKKEEQAGRFETKDDELESKLAHAAVVHKVHGTPVTPETFAEWKERFDAEMEAKKRAEMERLPDNTQKLTGRQLFEANKAIVTEDSSAFWEEEAEQWENEQENYMDNNDGGNEEEFEIDESAFVE